jgi:hypothetical protein
MPVCEVLHASRAEVTQPHPCASWPIPGPSVGGHPTGVSGRCPSSVSAPSCSDGRRRLCARLPQRMLQRECLDLHASIEDAPRGRIRCGLPRLRAAYRLAAKRTSRIFASAKLLFPHQLLPQPPRVNDGHQSDDNAGTRGKTEAKKEPLRQPVANLIKHGPTPLKILVPPASLEYPQFQKWGADRNALRNRSGLKQAQVSHDRRGQSRGQLG